jgi:hypothetical protein
MSRYKDIEGSLRYEELYSMLYTICHTWGGWTHLPRSAPLTGPASWFSTLLDSLSMRECLHALSCSSTRHTPRNVEFSCLLLLQCPGPGMSDCGPVGTATVLISSLSYCNASRSDLDRVMTRIHMIPVQYAFSLSA